MYKHIKLTFGYFIPSLSWLTEIAQDVIWMDVHCHASKKHNHTCYKMVVCKPWFGVLGKVPQSPGLCTAVQHTEEDGEHEGLERHWFAILDWEWIHKCPKEEGGQTTILMLWDTNTCSQYTISPCCTHATSMQWVNSAENVVSLWLSWELPLFDRETHQHN